MELLANGLLMPDHQEIKDPCQLGETSVVSLMMLQMSEDVPMKAQHDLHLRNINYRSASVRFFVI